MTAITSLWQTKGGAAAALLCVFHISETRLSARNAFPGDEDIRHVKEVVKHGKIGVEAFADLALAEAEKPCGICGYEPDCFGQGKSAVADEGPDEDIAGRYAADEGRAVGEPRDTLLDNEVGAAHGPALNIRPGDRKGSGR